MRLPRLSCVRACGSEGTPNTQKHVSALKRITFVLVPAVRLGSLPVSSPVGLPLEMLGILTESLPGKGWYCCKLSTPAWVTCVTEGS